MRRRAAADRYAHDAASAEASGHGAVRPPRLAFSTSENAAVAAYGKQTFELLSRLDIPYDELHFGKPWAQFYIDDCGVNAYADLEKELGYYPPTASAVASKYVPSPVASTPPSVVGRARHSSTTVVLAAALGVAVGVLAARK